MSEEIFVFDRVTKKIFVEQVYGKRLIETFYGSGAKSKFFRDLFLPLLAGRSLFSRLYGALQASPFSKYKIRPFIEKYGLDSSEFLLPVSRFSDFNDFFVRKLKPEARPIAPGEGVAVLPADGRYLVYPNISEADGFVVKGKKFTLNTLLRDEEEARRYERGSMVLARLCPTDYHRFHFPVAGTPSTPLALNGTLHSVNPLALRWRIEILSENKRMITRLETERFGRVLLIEVGALCVGSIHQTFTPGKASTKGKEKGFFSFGGSSLIVVFEEGRIVFDQDLLEASSRKTEVLGLMGQSLGTTPS